MRNVNLLKVAIGAKIPRYKPMAARHGRTAALRMVDVRLGQIALYANRPGRAV
jgi:hypothetical protein